MRHLPARYRIYAKALEKTRGHCLEAIIRQKRLRFAGDLARYHDRRLPTRAECGKLVGGEDPGLGRPAHIGSKSLRGNFKDFGTTDGSTNDSRRTLGIGIALWPKDGTEASKNQAKQRYDKGESKATEGRTKGETEEGGLISWKREYKVST